jgi:hypothetical protein
MLKKRRFGKISNKRRFGKMLKKRRFGKISNERRCGKTPIRCLINKGLCCKRLNQMLEK